MFPEKYVRVFPETRTRICENTYVFWETDNEVLNAFGKMYNNYVENVSPSNYRKFLGLYPNRPFSQYYSFLCRIYTSSALGDILHRPRK